MMKCHLLDFLATAIGNALELVDEVAVFEDEDTGIGTHPNAAGRQPPNTAFATIERVCSSATRCSSL